MIIWVIPFNAYRACVYVSRAHIATNGSTQDGDHASHTHSAHIPSLTQHHINSSQCLSDTHWLIPLNTCGRQPFFLNHGMLWRINEMHWWEREGRGLDVKINYRTNFGNHSIPREISIKQQLFGRHWYSKLEQQPL